MQGVVHAASTLRGGCLCSAGSCPAASCVPRSRVPCAGAFDGSRCVGFLRYLIQVIGAEEGRPAVMHNGAPLREGFVEAFGVDPQLRRRGIGTALQQHAAWQCRNARCYQMRSRSPMTSAENYALKIAAGYVLHPSHENDSYYFLRRL